MEEAAVVRRAAMDAVGDVEPEGLRERIEDRLDDGSLAPGALALLSARVAHDARSLDGEFAAESIAERGAGVQLIYEGLRLTRTLAQDPPWERARSLTDGAGETDVAGVGADGTPLSDPDGGDLTDADMAILVADVLVARGFYLLARTEAAGDAVATVRAFGRDQTTRRTSGDSSLDRNLERDVFELAAVAGTTAVGGAPSSALREYVADLAGTDDPLPLAEGIFTDATVADLAGHVDGGAGVAASGGD
jgi:hypothetical protein